MRNFRPHCIAATRLAVAAVVLLGSAWSLPASAQITDATRQAALAFATPGGGMTDAAASVSSMLPAARDGAIESRPTVWSVAADDGTVDRMLSRWAAVAKWRVVWEGAPEIPVMGTGHLPLGEFLQAAQYVIAQARDAGYAVVATAYSDRTLVVRNAPVQATTSSDATPPATTSQPASKPVTPAPAAPTVAAPAVRSEPAPTLAAASAAQRPVAPPAASTPPSAPTPSVAAPRASAAVWTIAKGQPIHVALGDWATKAGWSLIWYPTVSWKCVAAVDMSAQPDVTAAVAEVITVLRDEGKPVQLRIAEANRVMEVLSTEVKND